jgi:aspartyl-tRNA(Asn)/glutamyl-tRNA(Gln) amidotransferase subunit C
VTKFDIDHIADLARLYLTPKEKKCLGSQLQSILAYVGKITKARTKSASPTFQTTGLRDVTREDAVDSTRSLSQDGVLANAPSQESGFFKVKPVR